MRTKGHGLWVAVLLSWAAVATAGVQTKEVDYTQGDTALQGTLAWDDALPGTRPGVLVVHEWWGHNAHARRAAERLARAGYVAFALDMFGKGKVTTHPAEAQAFVAEATKDPAVMEARFAAARAQLEQDAHVDRHRIAAIGYCFGGAVVLGRALAGDDLAAVATFHGALGYAHPTGKDAIKARILVMTGTDDPMVPAAQVATFEKEMKAAGARFRIIRYPGARHSFTNPDADKVGMSELAYNAEADRKSWAAMLAMFKQALK